MHVNHVGRDITIGFDSKEEAEALFAVLTGTANQIDPKQAEYGNWLYKWFFERVQKLATDYDKEVAGYLITPRSKR